MLKKKKDFFFNAVVPGSGQLEGRVYSARSGDRGTTAESEGLGGESRTGWGGVTWTFGYQPPKPQMGEIKCLALMGQGVEERETVPGVLRVWAGKASPPVGARGLAGWG